MLQKILATSVLVTFLASTVSAQEAPGKSLPVESSSAEETLILNSASSDPTALTVSEVTVVPETNEAVLSFTTSQETHMVIEYGLTPEYDRSISTEPMTEHTETLGELLPCATYYYRVHSGDVSREGDFKTLCPKIVVQNTKYKVQNTVKKQKAVPVVSVAPVAEPVIAEPVIETVPVLNAAPEEVPVEPEVQNEETLPVVQEALDEEMPETPLQPTLIAADDVETPANGTPVALLLFALLSGMVVVFFTFKKQKKWYQK